ncbi:fic/DOC family protein [Colletotrichum orchidophilum]|uniref:Fic/DOC family protein n=1 Tax=Colletotrichum orchidophilum TaxID=1209926 RepID=A0A1G4AXC9_9PEZI|nr:fic/DOC family protein [Colletotrichum orchidophilum]OHE93765.1 fic/DOC family protein [Colletotrichum orchidophilum]
MQQACLALLQKIHEAVAPLQKGSIEYERLAATWYGDRELRWERAGPATSRKALLPLVMDCVLYPRSPISQWQRPHQSHGEAGSEGYVAVVIQDLKQQDYLRMIDGASKGTPEGFVTAVLHQANTRLKM